MNPTLHNRAAWDRLVEKGDVWTQPVAASLIAAARNGDWSIVLTPNKPVPRAWFPENLAGKNVLCLASGGGQQGPILAAAGAAVTVYDNSPRQLAQDEHVAQRDGLTIALELGDMRDLSRFDAASFDLVVNPVSNCFVDAVLPIWKEAYRVLKPGGSLLAGFANPLIYLFDLKAWNAGRLEVRHRIPYSDLQALSTEELDELILATQEPLCFGHSLHDQLQGQIAAGFAITGFYEDKAKDSPLDAHIDTFIATRATKAQG
jgi:SAM-dependent methyltransferase